MHKQCKKKKEKTIVRYYITNSLLCAIIKLFENFFFVEILQLQIYICKNF